MYSRHRCEKLPQQVQTLLSHKRGTYRVIFIAFLESPRNFAHFEKKDPLHTLNNSQVIGLEGWGYFNAHKVLFKNTLRK